MVPRMRIVVPEDTGRIEVVSAITGSDTRLRIPGDQKAPDHRQWFCFEAHDCAGSEQVFSLENAGDCTYADAFDGYLACASYEPEGADWFRVPTEFDGDTLRIIHTPKTEVVRYAYFAPHPAARRAALIDAVRSSATAGVRTLGTGTRGGSVDLLSFGSTDEGARKLWFIAQQHPGETMAGWFAEGLVWRLLDSDDAVAQSLLAHARVHVVCAMNPDGAAMGNHRTNAAGIDLNRCWWEADSATSPEVLAVRTAMYQEGVDFLLDVHGDEHVPHVFLAGAEGNPGFDDRIEALEEEFSNAMVTATCDFQTEEGYPKDAPGKGDLRTAGNYAGEAFGCLSLTLEMPFKDHNGAPDEERGWSPERSMNLAGAALEAVASVLDVLRD
jgi:hypothetical protein